jgi:hypothetical protein
MNGNRMAGHGQGNPMSGQQANGNQAAGQHSQGGQMAGHQANGNPAAGQQGTGNPSGGQQGTGNPSGGQQTGAAPPGQGQTAGNPAGQQQAAQRPNILQQVGNGLQGGQQTGGGAPGSGTPAGDSEYRNQQALQARYERLATGPVTTIQNERQAINRGTEVGAQVRALHLPTAAGAPGSRQPGVWVFPQMRRPVAVPRAHYGAPPRMGSPTGTNPKPTPFHLVPKTVGSHSARGDVLWPKEYPKNPSPGVKNGKGRTPGGRALAGQGDEDGGGDGAGLLGEYYLGKDFDQLMFRRPDATINFVWTSTQVDPRMPLGQPFSVRWTGKIVPRYSEVYTIYTASDDGVRLWIDDKLLIENWTIHGVTEDVTQVALEAGHAYPIRLEYFEKNGLSNEIIKLYWESPSEQKAYVPEECLRYPKVEDIQP